LVETEGGHEIFLEQKKFTLLYSSKTNTMASINTNNKFWKKALSSAQSDNQSAETALGAIPEDYSSILSPLTESVGEDLSYLNDTVSKDATQYKLNTVDSDADTITRIGTYQDEYTYVSDPNQAKFDSLLHQAYAVGKLSTVSTGSPGYFSDFYNTIMEKQMTDHNKNLEAKNTEVLKSYQASSDIMDVILKYQTYILALQTAWANMYTQQGSDQLSLMSDLQDQTNTGKRKTSYLFTSIISDDNLTHWLELLAILLVVFIVVVYVYKKINWGGIFYTAGQTISHTYARVTTLTTS